MTCFWLLGVRTQQQAENHTHLTYYHLIYLIRFNIYFHILHIWHQRPSGVTNQTVSPHRIMIWQEKTTKHDLTTQHTMMLTCCQNLTPSKPEDSPSDLTLSEIHTAPIHPHPAWPPANKTHKLYIKEQKNDVPGINKRWKEKTLLIKLCEGKFNLTQPSRYEQAQQDFIISIYDEPTTTEI